MSYQRQKTLKLKHLKCVLDNLYYAENNCSAIKYFEKLIIVQQGIKARRHIMIDDQALLKYTIQHILSEMIQVELQKQRHILGVAHRHTDRLETQRQVVHVIQCDAHTQSIPLIGWSLLYHVHIRPEFNITYNLFAKIVSVEARTVRRYKNQATNLLLQRLIQAEAQVT